MLGGLRKGSVSILLYFGRFHINQALQLIARELNHSPAGKEKGDNDTLYLTLRRGVEKTE